MMRQDEIIGTLCGVPFKRGSKIVAMGDFETDRERYPESEVADLAIRVGSEGVIVGVYGPHLYAEFGEDGIIWDIATRPIAFVGENEG